MKSYYTITGMTCQSCASKIKEELLKLASVKGVGISVEKKEAEIELAEPISFQDIAKAVSNAGSKYHIEAADDPAFKAIASEEASPVASYKPLILVFLFIIVVSGLASLKNGEINVMKWMNDFMAGFFIVFSFFKLLDLRAFAESYRQYDLPSRSIPGYAYLYPFLELALGLGYLAGIRPLSVNIVSLSLMSISSIGVIQALLRKDQIKCACLGAVFNLPMSYITLLEDLLMAIMAGIMIIYHIQG